MIETLIGVWICGVFSTGVAMTLANESRCIKSPPLGEAVAFVVFWPLTLTFWLLLNLYRLAWRMSP